jgi:hypothetical protein
VFAGSTVDGARYDIISIVGNALRPSHPRSVDPIGADIEFDIAKSVFQVHGVDAAAHPTLPQLTALEQSASSGHSRGYSSGPSVEH